MDPTTVANGGLPELREATRAIAGTTIKMTEREIATKCDDLQAKLRANPATGKVRVKDVSTVGGVVFVRSLSAAEYDRMGAMTERDGANEAVRWVSAVCALIPGGDAWEDFREEYPGAGSVVANFVLELSGLVKVDAQKK